MSTNPSPNKQTKVYQIAVELAQYEPPEYTQIQKLQLNRSQTSPYLLPKILDVDDEDQEHTPRKKRQSPFKNIFMNIQKNDHLKPDELINDDKSYNIVGRKEVKSYLTKLVKKRNPYFRRNQSALSISRYSSSVRSQHQTNAYLNKQDVLNFIKPTSTQQSPNIVSPRNQQILTIQTNNKSSISIDMFSLKKNKQAFQSYSRTWDKERMKKIKFPSILDHIARYREKVQIKEGNSLIEQKLHTKDKVWVDTLRTEKTTENYYDDKFVQRIIPNPLQFSIKGQAKFQKQMQWIDQKDKAGYSFAFIEGWMSKRSGNLKDNGRGSYLKDQNKLGQGITRGNMTRRELVEKMSVSAYSMEGKMVRRNQSMGDMQSAVKSSGGQVLALFQNSQSLSLTQSIKNRPSLIMTPNPILQQPTITSTKRLII